MAIKTISANRQAYHDYHILEKFEAGISLTGTEIKSIRAGQVNLRESYAKMEGRQIWLHNFHIARYDPGNRFNHDPLRSRRLLLHKDEIRKLKQEVEQKGLTIVTVQLYIKDRHAKVEIALARGKKQYDKRESIAKRDMERDIEREFAGGARGR
ncbi:MAG: SsrA-binding protein SmpB [Dehalococcoidia bacterium]|nr:SsrA-binding protein SmpB [Dehalococcoidia bacterium]